GGTTQLIQGTGKITSNPVGIDCGDTCGTHFAKDSQIVLTAVADSGSTFAGWTGACAGVGRGPCTVTMGSDQTVNASFTKPANPGEGGPSFGGSIGIKLLV